MLSEADLGKNWLDEGSGHDAELEWLLCLASALQAHRNRQDLGAKAQSANGSEPFDFDLDQLPRRPPQNWREMLGRLRRFLGNQETGNR